MTHYQQTVARAKRIVQHATGCTPQQADAALKAAQDALVPPYYNEFPALRKGRPRIYFDGNNLDPDTLSVLLQNLDPSRTFVIVISKSGETTETKAAFTVVEK